MHYVWQGVIVAISRQIHNVKIMANLHYVCQGTHKGKLRQVRQIQYRPSHYSAVKDRKMASEEIGQNEFIAHKVAEATRVTIQTMASISMARQENAGMKMSSLILKQPMFNCRAKNRYKELQNFELEVSNMLQNYNLGQRQRVSVIKS